VTLGHYRCRSRLSVRVDRSKVRRYAVVIDGHVVMIAAVDIARAIFVRRRRPQEDSGAGIFVAFFVVERLDVVQLRLDSISQVPLDAYLRSSSIRKQSTQYNRPTLPLRYVTSSAVYSLSLLACLSVGQR